MVGGRSPHTRSAEKSPSSKPHVSNRYIQKNRKVHGIAFFSGEISHKVYLLFSRHSSKARTSGTINPKMLNQTGT
jgi:hypothetical protein